MVRENEAVSTVQGVFADFGRGDIPTLLTRLTDDVVWTTPGAGTRIPAAGRLQGKAAVAEFFAGVSRELDFHAFNPNEFFSEGDVVIAIGTWDATVKGTDVRIQDDWAMKFTLRDGKIAEFREYSDSHSYAEALAARS